MLDRVGVTFNAGSSTLKVGVFNIRAGYARPIGRRVVVWGEEPRLKYIVGEELRQTDLPVDRVDQGLISFVLDHLLPTGPDVAFVGHRVLHGGSMFHGPALLDDTALVQIESLVPIAPSISLMRSRSFTRSRRCIPRSCRRHPSTPRSILRSAACLRGLRSRALCTRPAFGAMDSTAFPISTSPPNSRTLRRTWVAEG